MKIADIIFHIRNEADGDDIRRIMDACHAKHSLETAIKIGEFHPRDKVYFVTRPTSRYAGRRVEGVVIKQNRKTIAVRANDGREWRVAPSFLHTM